MTFSLRSLALAILAIAALAGGAVALTNPKSDSTGFRMAVPQDRFRDHDLRVADPAAGSASVGHRGS
jgi:hypothetical protein